MKLKNALLNTHCNQLLQAKDIGEGYQFKVSSIIVNTPSAQISRSMSPTVV